jgi:hypothetical protein
MLGGGGGGGDEDERPLTRAARVVVVVVGGLEMGVLTWRRPDYMVVELLVLIKHRFHAPICRVNV